ncbi:MAG: serine/threonine-protein phosphatase [Verrucomicrobia bacterium]|nr:serine/threonine-protein phosphatase [Verrucomicrobiota bacterium]
MNPQETPSECFSVGELELARRIHRSLLPGDFQNEHVDIAVRYHEMARLGGDYATVHPRKDGSIFLAVCDVTGHGIASALLAARVNSFVRQRAMETRRPCEVAVELNRFIHQFFSGCGVFVTFFCAEVDLAARRIDYAGCGHPPALLCGAKAGTCERLASQQTMIGIFPEFEPACFTAGARYEPGDRLFLYTDGVIEASNARGEFFDLDGLNAFAQRLPATITSAQAADELLRDVGAFQEGEFADDVLAMVVTFRPPNRTIAGIRQPVACI